MEKRIWVNNSDRIAQMVLMPILKLNLKKLMNYLKLLGVQEGLDQLENE